MADLRFGTNDNETVKVWSKLLYAEFDKSLELSPLIGEGAGNAIRRMTELEKGPGDRIRVQMVPQLVGQGYTEGETLTGKEEALASYTADVTIGELYKPVDLIPRGSMSHQRVWHDLREEARDALKDWFSTRFSVAFFMHEAGYLGTSITVEGLNWPLTGTDGNKLKLFNEVLASTNIIRAGAQATDQAITSSDVFSLDLIDKAVTRAKLANPGIRPFMVGGRKKYVMYLHPSQVLSLRTASYGPGSWSDYSKLVGSPKEQESRIYEGAIGEYNGVILREHEHVAPGYHSTTFAEITTVRRAVLIGADSAALAFGRESKGMGRFIWREQYNDYERKQGVAAGLIVGMKKNQFNSKDWGTVVVSTYAPAV
jgi:hypothetical protein